jgi:hypothetical protein
MASLRHTQTRPPAEESRFQTDLRALVAVTEASSSNGMHTHPTRRSALTDAGRIYVDAILDHYLWLPGTPARASRHDRRLARTLYERGVTLRAIRAALVLGAARRVLRSKDAPALPPIRTLHYFLPLLEEIIELPPDDGYVEYLEAKLAPLADAKTERSGHIQSG